LPIADFRLAALVAWNNQSAIANRQSKMFGRVA
jgi:hypothetical protein